MAGPKLSMGSQDDHRVHTAPDHRKRVDKPQTLRYPQTAVSSAHPLSVSRALGVAVVAHVRATSQQSSLSGCRRPPNPNTDNTPTSYVRWPIYIRVQLLARFPECLRIGRRMWDGGRCRSAIGTGVFRSRLGSSPSRDTNTWWAGQPSSRSRWSRSVSQWVAVIVKGALFEICSSLGWANLASPLNPAVSA